MAISEQLQQRINNLTQGMGATSNKEMEMLRDASPRMGLTRADGLNTMPATPELTKPEIALERIKDIARNVEDPDELQRLLQVINNMSEQINQPKGAISNKEMEMFRDASPSMGTIGGGRMEIGDGSPSMGAIGGGRMEMFRPSMGTMGGGRAPISDQERQMFMDSIPRQTDETQQAIDSLQQELQMTADPEEAEGLGRMIAKLSASMMAPLGGVAKQVAQAGGGEDTALAHVRPGEIVLPPEMMEDPQFEMMVEEKFNQLGINPEEAVVGMGIASLNQSTGLEEFGFFKKLGKKLGKVVKKVAPIAMLVPGVGTALGGALGGLGGLATKGLAKVGLGGLGSALGSVGSTVMGGIANAGIPGLSSIAGGTASGFGGIKAGLGSLKGLVGDGPLSGLLGMGQQPTIEEIGATDPSTQVRIDRLRAEGMSDAQIMQNLQQSGMVPQASQGNFNLGRALTGGAGRTPDMIKSIEDRIKGQGGSMFGGGQGGGLGALGTAGLLGLAGSLGKMAYDETKKDTGVPLTPLNTMNAAGRFNLEAEIARRMGQQAPNPVEFGLLPQNTLPELSGGQAVPTGMMMGGEVMMPMEMAQGGSLPNKGLEALNRVAPEVVDRMGYNMGGYVMPMQYAEGGNVAMEDFERKNGMINGMGTETSDDVPAMLSDGEFVMTGQAVRGAGSYQLEQGDGGILNLIPSLDEDRERGTELMYNMMEVFSNRANAS